jgi:hypothetical protein
LKQVKKARHEQEKTLMETLSGMGNAVGEYIGHGRGDSDNAAEVSASVDRDIVDADLGVDDLSMDEDEDSSDDAHPLLYFYDCETTGFSIYSDHITHMLLKLSTVQCLSEPPPSPVS